LLYLEAARRVLRRVGEQRQPRLLLRFAGHGEVTHGLGIDLLVAIGGPDPG